MATRNTKPEVIEEAIETDNNTTYPPVTDAVESTETTAPEKKVIVNIPRRNKDDDSEFVSVNERTWQIKKGVDVEVPECVAEVLRNRDTAALVKYAYEEKKSK